jgi:5'-nucleotidase
MPRPVGETREVALDVDGHHGVEAWSVDASPALAVRWAVLIRAAERPDLAVCGINYGENLGVSLSISGTVGAAIEAAGHGVPAVAVSLQTEVADHDSHSTDVDFRVAGAVTRRLARAVLASGMPTGVHALNVNVPRTAEEGTPWRVTRVSRHHYFESIVRAEAGGQRRMVGYRRVPGQPFEPDADARALLDGAVSITPLTMDQTAHGGAGPLRAMLGDALDDGGARS